MELQRYRWEVRTMAALNSCSRWQREADCAILTPSASPLPGSKVTPRSKANHSVYPGSSTSQAARKKIFFWKHKLEVSIQKQALKSIGSLQKQALKKAQLCQVLSQIKMFFSYAQRSLLVCTDP